MRSTATWCKQEMGRVIISSIWDPSGGRGYPHPPQTPQNRIPGAPIYHYLILVGKRCVPQLYDANKKWVEWWYLPFETPRGIRGTPHPPHTPQNCIPGAPIYHYLILVGKRYVPQPHAANKKWVVIISSIWDHSGESGCYLPPSHPSKPRPWSLFYYYLIVGGFVRWLCTEGKTRRPCQGSWRRLRSSRCH